MRFPFGPEVVAFLLDQDGHVRWWSAHLTPPDGGRPSLEYMLTCLGISPGLWGRLQTETEIEVEGGWLHRLVLMGGPGQGTELYVRYRIPRGSGKEERGHRLASPSSVRLIGESHALRTVQEQVARAARTDAPVLLTGETGVGKELFARLLHELSSRSEAPFVALNCAALPESVAEAELFGYDRGAFTGAAPEGRPGHFERAEGGTLFLDEVADLSLPLQAKLLRALQEGEIERVGGRRSIKVNVRIVSATNQDLRELIRAGRFRSDLYFRINVLRILVPPLRERREDIPLLVRHYLSHFCSKWDLGDKTVSPQAAALLQAYDWPGNVRELISCTQRLALLTAGDVVEADDVRRALEDLGTHAPPMVAGAVEAGHPALRDTPGSRTAAGAGSPPAPAASLPAQTAELERQMIVDALARAGGNKVLAAQLLGINRSTLYEKMQRYAIVPAREADGGRPLRGRRS